MVKFWDSNEDVTWRQLFGRMLRINMKIEKKVGDQFWRCNKDQDSNLEDLNWRSILVTSEISFEDQNPFGRSKLKINFSDFRQGQL